MATRLCPRCSSENIEPEVADFSGFLHGSINKWNCQDCNYIGLAPEKTSEENENSPSPEKEGNSEELTFTNYLIILLVALLVGLLMLSLF